ncbi:MAG: aminoacyl-tRNA hydrolase, partial [Planctomycetaceae bacterium]|nr:aminoacyl-tRNA hydrolase [Planctomycetaceae bacterium]MDR1142334.1 aminoacyl-tRNA hydrolase [Planctomycetaceae bacterium]
MLRINSKLQIPMDEIRFSYARSSGPGGQNVNKVSSKAVLR